MNSGYFLSYLKCCYIKPGILPRGAKKLAQIKNNALWQSALWRLAQQLFQPHTFFICEDDDWEQLREKQENPIFRSQLHFCMEQIVPLSIVSITLINMHNEPKTKHRYFCYTSNWMYTVQISLFALHYCTEFGIQSVKKRIEQTSGVGPLKNTRLNWTDYQCQECLKSSLKNKHT